MGRKGIHPMAAADLINLLRDLLLFLAIMQTFNNELANEFILNITIVRLMCKFCPISFALHLECL
jgi:hypothetical protein